jgi:hypothetical protein
VYDSRCYHFAHKIYTAGQWANDFDSLFRMEPQYIAKGVRYIENHDEVRVCSPLAWNGVGERILPAIATVVYASGKGPVLVYNGQEVGERAEGPGGYGGHDGKTSIFDYTCLPQLQPWIEGGRCDDSLLCALSAGFRDFHKRLLPLLQLPALAEGDYYGLNWANMQNTSFGREPTEEVSGHWVWAMLRHVPGQRGAVLIVANLSPEISFYNLSVSIPQNAFDWCGIGTDGVCIKNLLYPEQGNMIQKRLDLMTRGLVWPLKPGAVAVLELTEFADAD